MENRNHKDSLFIDLFCKDQKSGKENFISLYNALHQTNLDLKTTTLEDKGLILFGAQVLQQEHLARFLVESLERKITRRNGVKFIVSVFIRFGFERGRQDLFSLACDNDVVVARHALNLLHFV